MCVGPPAFESLLERLAAHDTSPEHVADESRFRRLGRRLWLDR
ncbi:hypothetical protein [Actinomadura sp. CNU-125]|nr:hypothetical protein [Actinomadura sp. CNU-125]